MPETSAAPGFTRIDNQVITQYAPRIGAQALAVYVVLGLHADSKTRQCYPSTRTIARLLHLSQPTVLKAILTLEGAGLIQVVRNGTHGGKRQVNVYTLLQIEGANAGSAPVLNDVEHGAQSPLAPTLKQIEHIAKGGLAEQDLTNKTQENQGESAPPGRTPAPARARASYLDHPAVKAYRGICQLTPNEAQRAAIAEVVTDIGRWQEALRKWLLAGYRASNVDGMLDWHKDGIPERRGGNGRTGTSGRLGFGGGWDGERRERRSPDSPEDTARRDAEWQKLVQESQRS